MKMNIRRERLAFAVAGAVTLVSLTVQAEDFTASTTLLNTLAVTNIQNLDIGSVFATETGANYADGVGALVISPLGVVSDPTDSADVNLTSLSDPTAGQGSVNMANEFNLTFPNTSTIIATEFDGAAVTSYANWTNGTAIELVHESGNPVVPSLYLMHFTIGDVSGGAAQAEASDGAGVFQIIPEFGETTYVFNIGATITTKPVDGGTAETYQEGLYSGTFSVTAAY